MTRHAGQKQETFGGDDVAHDRRAFRRGLIGESVGGWSGGSGFQAFLLGWNSVSMDRGGLKMA